MSDQPQWKKFEHLAAEIQSQLSPKARVQTNVKLLGKRSGIERQIDILVEQEVGQYEIRIVIDCKDYKHPVDVKDIEMFMGMVEDVSANKGANSHRNRIYTDGKETGTGRGHRHLPSGRHG